MTNKVNSKQRYVRCPKCLNVLLEPANVPVYKCGGCDATLQAKKQNKDTINSKSRKLDDDCSGKQKVGQVFDNQEAGSSSNPQLLVNSTDELDQNSDGNDLHRSKNDQDAANKASSDGKLKMKQLSNDHEASSSSNQESLVHPLDEPHRSNHNDPRSSTELSGHDDPESSPEATGHNRIDQEQEQNQQVLLNSSDESDQNSDNDDLHRSNKVQDAGNKANDAPAPGVKEYSSEKQKMKQLSNDHEASSSSNQQPLVRSMDEHEPLQNIHNDPRSSTELSGHDDPESSPEATGHNRADQEQEHDQNKKRDQDHYQVAAKKLENTTVKPTYVDDEPCRSLNQQLVVNSVNHQDQNSDHEEPDSSPEATIHNRIDEAQIDDNDQVFLSCRRELEVEESSSEFEEAFTITRNVRVSDTGSKSSFKNLIAEKLLETKQKKQVYLDEDDTSSENESADLHHHHHHHLHHRRRNDHKETSRFGGVNYYGSVGNDYQNPRKHRIDSGNGYRFNRRNQNHHLNNRLDDNDVRSSHDLNPKHHRSHMIAENPKLERIKLLNIVRDLQNQLERTNVSTPPQVPSFGRRMAFSGEATAVNRRLDGGACHHCCPQGQNRHFSAQLPGPHVCFNGPYYEPNSYYSPRFSAMSSPIHNHLESEFSAPDDYIHRNHDVANVYRSPKKKRYIRPIASGTPWVTCYRCSTLLELPQSFLVLNKKYHSLKCGACMKVLIFTLLNGTHISRYYPEEKIAAPPSSEVEDYDEMIRSRVGPVSCSDRSFQKSCSTETDRNGSWAFSEERKKATMSRDPSGSTQPSSSKVLGRSRFNGSPLHRLMGYASPSKVIRS